MRLPRAAAALAIAVSVGLGTTGCFYLTPNGTGSHYNPSDGVNVRVGTVDVRNAVAVSNRDGLALSLMITLVNTGGAKTVNLQFESEGQRTDYKVTLPSDAVKQFGNTPEQDQIIVMFPSVKPGELLPVYIQYGKEPGKNILVPVVDGTLAEYEGLMPPEIAR